jgi:hypothetical protein
MQLCAHLIAPAVLDPTFLPPLAIAWCVPPGATTAYKEGGFPHRSVLPDQPTRLSEELTCYTFYLEGAREFFSAGYSPKS